MIEVKAFKCEHCAGARKTKVYGNKSSCRTHEKKCFHNPENHACATCGLWVDEYGDHRTRLAKSCDEDHQTEGRLQNHCPHWVPIPEEVEA